jgi:hypothetical protein
VGEGNGFRESTHKFFNFFLFFANVAMKCVVEGNGFKESTHKFFNFFIFCQRALCHITGVNTMHLGKKSFSVHLNWRICEG